MIALIRPTRIAIYVNSGHKTMAQVKAETGCQYILNGGLFNSDFTPCPLLKVDGKWQTDIPWTAWGMTWNNADDCHMDSNTGADNYIYCVDLINPWSFDHKPQYPADMGGARPRTAWGMLADGRHILYCSNSPRTPEDLRTYLMSGYDLSCLLMLDGGGSTQGDFNGKKVTSSRIVHNFICFWTDPITTDDQPEQTAKETSTMLSKGSKGEAVRSLQTRLKKLAFTDLVVDGDFGTATHNASSAFQSAVGLVADGIIGPATQAMLDRCVGYAEGTGTLVDELIAKAATQIGTAEPDGDNAYIAAYNSESGAGFGNTVAWCQIFAWWVLSYFAVPDTPVTASCTAAMKHYKAKNMWHEVDGYTPKKGDLIYFDWDKTGDCDHVGFVAEVADGYVYSIEGNSGGTNGKDGVCLKKYTPVDKNIRGYASLEDKPAVTGDYTIHFTNKADADSFLAANINKYPSMEVR